jgi:hypothetical protein
MWGAVSFLLEFKRRQGEGCQYRLRYAMFHAQAEKMSYYMIPVSNSARDLSRLSAGRWQPTLTVQCLLGKITQLQAGPLATMECDREVVSDYH